MSTSPLKLGGLALGLTLLSAVTFSGAAQAYQCKNNFVQVETIGVGQLATKSNGRKAWSDKVEDDYHLAWSVWSIANNKSQTCQKTGNNWYCVTKAKPCLYVVQ